MGLIKYNTNDFRPTSFRSFVDDFFNNDFNGGTSASFTPKVDVAETDNEFEVQLHLPGLKKEDIKIDINKDRLSISGERKFENKKSEKNYHSVESYYGSFSRSFHLPDTINTEKIDAAYVDGVLTVTLPKDEKKVTKKQILIK
ncbi:MAG: Hsp20/alpha crystallin family protein [Bacteroidota bacterium]